MAEETTTEEVEETTATETDEVAVEDTKVTPEDDWKAKARKHEKASKKATEELEQARQKLKEYEDRDKTEAEKAEEARKALEARAAKAEAELVKTRIGGKYNLPPEVAELLPDGSEEEVEAKAQSLAELVKATDKPVVDTDAGKGSGSSGETSFNDLIRGSSAR